MKKVKMVYEVLNKTTGEKICSIVLELYVYRVQCTLLFFKKDKQFLNFPVKLNFRYSVHV